MAETPDEPRRCVLIGVWILALWMAAACQSTPESHLEECWEATARAAVRRHGDRPYREILCTAEGSRLRLEAPLNAQLRDGSITGLQPGQFVTLREDRRGSTLEASFREVRPDAFDWVVYEKQSSGPPTSTDKVWIDGCLRHLQAHELLVERAVDDLLALTESGPEAYRETFRRAATLGFTRDRIQVLAALADRPDLPSDLQVDLIHFVINEIAYSSDQMQVLGRLIENAGFSAEARRTILENVELFGFAADRRRLRRVLDPSAVGVEPIDGP